MGLRHKSCPCSMGNENIEDDQCHFSSQRNLFYFVVVVAAAVLCFVLFLFCYIIIAKKLMELLRQNLGVSGFSQ